jgi:hypothetical protein
VQPEDFTSDIRKILYVCNHIGEMHEILPPHHRKTAGKKNQKTYMWRYCRNNHTVRGGTFQPHVADSDVQSVLAHARLRWVQLLHLGCTQESLVSQVPCWHPKGCMKVHGLAPVASGDGIAVSRTGLDREG